jgi:hypothetical protein
MRKSAAVVPILADAGGYVTSNTARFVPHVLR